MKISFLALIVFVGFLLPSIVSARGAALDITLTKKSIPVGTQLTVDVYGASSRQAFNAISGSVVFPSSSLRFVEIIKTGSVVDFWTEEPHLVGNKIYFEGVILNPGYQGTHGGLFQIVFEGRSESSGKIYVADGAILANDGLGSNIATSLGSAVVNITGAHTAAIEEILELSGKTATASRLLALPVITEYSRTIDTKTTGYIKGKGEPDALTKIIFKDVGLKSLGEQFIGYLQTKKKKLDEVLVRNDDKGVFEYLSPENLVAGAYNATPFLVDPITNTEKPGLGVQLLVSDSKIVRGMVIVINVLGLMIPIVGLIVLIYLIPWYSWRKMRVVKKRLGLEEEKIDLTTHQLIRRDTMLEKAADTIPPTGS